ncbi:MAG: UbiA prenyltransferase family protein [Candidatus Roizmanbacteria bacterium]
MRINQWIKNLVVFIPIIFSGKLFDSIFFFESLYAFIVFCILSSTSYLLNDIIDYPFDRKHPIKKNRPIASGGLKIQEATFIVFISVLVILIVSLFFSIGLFIISFIFILLHVGYSLYLKKHPVVDIFSISLSFVLRIEAGSIATGFHVPIWLLMTIFFGSLFMASVKRHAELVTHGSGARESLVSYTSHLLYFMTNTFATATIIAYSFYTYFEPPPRIEVPIFRAFVDAFPGFEARKWMMISIPLIVYGISRYAQLLYDRAGGERPEKVITTDKPLIITIFLWGVVVIGLIYLL